MSSSGNHPMDGKVDVDETYVGGQDEKVVGRHEGKKQIIVVTVERKGSLPHRWACSGDCCPEAPEAVHTGPYSSRCSCEDRPVERL